jgi:hypothetical protein
MALQLFGYGVQRVAGPVDAKTVRCIGFYSPFPLGDQYLIRSSSQGGSGNPAGFV